MYTLKMFFKVLVIHLMGLVLCSGRNPILELNILTIENEFTCENTVATVLEGEPLTIQVNFKHLIDEIRCRYETKFNNSVKQHNEKSISSGVHEVSDVTAIMGTVWKCTILTLPGIKSIRTAPCDDNRYMCLALDCQIKMHVRRKEAPQVILVNNMILPSKRAELHESYDALAEYTFHDGDLVKVTCANPRESTCNLKINYEHSRYFTNYTLARFLTKDPVGFQLRMRAGEDNTHALCTCVMSDDTSTVRVNFNMRKHPIGDSINVYINDAALRTTAIKTSEYDAVYEYMYQVNEVFHVTCENASTLVHGDEVQFNFINNPFPEDDYKSVSTIDDTKGITKCFNIRDQVEVSFECSTTLYKIMVSLKPRDYYEQKSECALRAEVKHPNAIASTSLELYSYNRLYLIYEYKDNDTFNLTCTASCKLDEFTIDLVYSNGSSRGYNASKGATKALTKEVNQSEIETDNVFRCMLNSSGQVDLIRTLVFVHYVPTPTSTAPTSPAPTSPAPSSPTPTSPTLTSTTTTSPAPTSASITTKTTISQANFDPDDPNKSKLPAAVGSVISIVVFCVFAVIYKIRNRKNNEPNPRLQPSDVHYENMPYNNENPIPPFPSQCESNYADPVDRAEDPAYCEPISGPRANIKNELYTMPIPKARRKPANNQTTEPAYEELDVDRAPVMQNARDEPNYAEIAPNVTTDLMYSEITPKTEPKNLNGSEYSNVKGENQNYAQVVPKSVRGKQVQDASSGKYANVHDERRYVNANTGSEYAEPAYCEPAYINNKP